MLEGQLPTRIKVVRVDEIIAGREDDAQECCTNIEVHIAVVGLLDGCTETPYDGEGEGVHDELLLEF